MSPSFTSADSADEFCVDHVSAQIFARLCVVPVKVFSCVTVPLLSTFFRVYVGITVVTVAYQETQFRLIEKSICIHDHILTASNAVLSITNLVCKTKFVKVPVAG